MTIQNLDEIRTFIQIAESGSLTKAGKVLSIPTTAVSRQLAKLEERLGVSLATRTTRRFTLTDAGESLYESGLALIEHADAAVRALRPDDPLDGVLRFVVPSLLAERIRAELFATMAEHPKLQVSMIVTDAPADVIVRMIPERGIDAAVLVGPLAASSLIARKLHTIRSYLGTGSDYAATHALPKHPRELSNHECLCYIGERLEREWTLIDRQGRQAQVRVRGRLASTSSHELREALVAGLGIGLVSELDIDRDDVVQVLPRWRFPDFQLWLGYPENRRGSARIEVLEKLLRQSLS